MAIKSQPHVLILPYPGQGHINPMLHFSKRLATKGPLVTLVTTRFILNSVRAQLGPVRTAPISDGHDRTGFADGVSLEDYLASLADNGSRTLSDLIEAQARSDSPFTCLVCDTYVPWGLDVAKRVGLPAVGFSTQSCAVSAVYYYVNEGRVEVPRVGSYVSVAGSVPLGRSEFPSLALEDAAYPTLARYALNQFDKLETGDWVLFNSVDELENKVITCLKGHWHARNIGPTVPLMAVDKCSDYGMNLLQAADKDTCIKWLDTKPTASVVYVSFGSFALLEEDQMEEMARGLIDSGKNFLWVVRSSQEKNMPKWFAKEAEDKGLVVQWSFQLAILAHSSVGCFVTHCGWNSTTEALSLGVPMVAMPQWTDQPTNAKHVEEVWGVGVRAKVDAEKGITMGGELERCIREVMDGEKSEEIRRNARKWKEVVEVALSEGGSSDENMNEFVEFLNAKAESGGNCDAKAENGKGC